MLKPIVDKGDAIKSGKLCGLAKVKLDPLFIAPGFRGADKGKDIICMGYASGECMFTDCERAHLYCNEGPARFGAKIMTAIAPRVAKYMGGERAPYRR